MTNRERYLDEISNRTPDYKVKITDFITWLIANNEVDEFRHQLHLIAIGDWDVYDTAFDFSIPVSMVRWLKKVLL